MSALISSLPPESTLVDRPADATPLAGTAAATQLTSISEATGLPQADCQTASPSPERPWLINPVLDILFALGGLMWIISGLHMVQGHFQYLKPVVLLLTGFGTYVLTTTHFGTTVIRAHDQGMSRFAISSSKFSVCAAIVAFCCTQEILAVVLCKVYLLAVIPHYCGQICSIAKIYLKRARYQCGRLEEWLLQSVVFAAGGFLMVEQFTDANLSTSLLGLKLPFWGPLPSNCSTMAALLMVSLCIVYALTLVKRALREKVFLPLPVMLLMLSGICIFIPNQYFGDMIGFYAPAYFHGLQHIYVNLADKFPAPHFTAQRDHCFLPAEWMEEKAQIYLALAFGIGCMAVFAIPDLLNHLGAQTNLVLPVVLSLFSFHHFYVDLKLWRRMVGL
jgi:hypothetical protein